MGSLLTNHQLMNQSTSDMSCQLLKQPWLTIVCMVQTFEQDNHLLHLYHGNNNSKYLYKPVIHLGAHYQQDIWDQHP